MPCRHVDAGGLDNGEFLDMNPNGRNPVLADGDVTGDIPVTTSLYRYFEMGIPTPEIPDVRRWYGVRTDQENLATLE